MAKPYPQNNEAPFLNDKNMLLNHALYEVGPKLMISHEIHMPPAQHTHTGLGFSPKAPQKPQKDGRNLQFLPS